MPTKDVKRFAELLRQSLLEIRLLIRLSLDEQLLWRRGEVKNALAVLRFKKEVVTSYNVLNVKRQVLQAELAESLNMSDSHSKECRSTLESLRSYGAYLHLINKNTMTLASRALQHNKPNK